MQAEAVPWMRVSGPDEAIEFARQVEAAPRMLFDSATSISGAIDHGMRLLAQAPFAAPRQVIDISGDGANNQGWPVEYARDKAVGAGMVINGLPILAEERNLDDYYVNTSSAGEAVS